MLLLAVLGSMIGWLMTFVYLNYSLSFWQGSRFLVWHETNLNAVITVLLAVMIGAFSL
jgi:ATP-binding cassette subfamily B (MDR/TAP) protein 1